MPGHSLEARSYDNMSDVNAQRFDHALSSLIEILVPAQPGEDEETTDDRQDDALELARSLIERSVDPSAQLTNTC